MKDEKDNNVSAPVQPGPRPSIPRCPKCGAGQDKLALDYRKPITPQDDTSGPYVYCEGCKTKTFTEMWRLWEIAAFFPVAAPSAELEQEWVRVQERMPEYGTVSLVYCVDVGDVERIFYQSIATYSYHGGWCVGMDKPDVEVHYWQPLPAPPEQIESLRRSVPAQQFFCEQCKTFKSVDEQYPNCPDSTICNSCAEEHISGKSL